MLATIHPGSYLGSPMQYIQNIVQIHKAIIPRPMMKVVIGTNTILWFDAKNYPVTPTISDPKFIFYHEQQIYIAYRSVMTAAITPPAIDVFHSVEFGGCFYTCKKHQREIKQPITNIINIEI